MSRFGKFLLALGIGSAIMAFLVLMGSLVYPGAMEWTAPWTCPDDQQDTIVVRDTYQTEPGETSTNFTLYCLGERGDFTDAGFGKPMLVLIVFGVIALVAFVVVVNLINVIRAAIRAVRSRDTEGPPGPSDVDGDGVPDSGPFADSDDTPYSGPIIT